MYYKFTKYFKNYFEYNLKLNYYFYISNKYMLYERFLRNSVYFMIIIYYILKLVYYSVNISKKSKLKFIKREIFIALPVFIVIIIIFIVLFTILSLKLSNKTVLPPFF